LLVSYLRAAGDPEIHIIVDIRTCHKAIWHAVGRFTHARALCGDIGDRGIARDPGVDVVVDIARGDGPVGYTAL